MKLRHLLEATEQKNLIGMKINGKLITPETSKEIWAGDFYCNDLKLTSLEGAPSRVNGNFNCGGNLFSSLEGAPSYVNGDFYCNDGYLTSLEGAPTHVGKTFHCSDNSLTSLMGAPSSVSGDFYCNDGYLTSLEGAPRYVNGDFYCAVNKLTSLEGVHKIFKEINGGFYAFSNLIESHVLGLLLIKGINYLKLDNDDVSNIVSNYLPNTKGNRGVIECQSELIDAGFDEFAKL